MTTARRFWRALLCLDDGGSDGSGSGGSGGEDDDGDSGSGERSLAHCFSSRMARARARSSPLRQRDDQL